MANTIKLKRGSGSDPGSSDLAVGELAVRTDTALLFTKNDGGSVVPIGISDGDKGDITVSSNGGTFTIDNDAVSYAKIQNVSATNRILGRDSSGAGDIEEISPSSLRTMINVADGATNNGSGIGVTDGDKGDITVASSGTSWTIDDDAVDKAAIADESVDEARLEISNSGSNGQFLSKQSGNTGGLTWADVTLTTINSNANNRVITGSGTADTLNGESNLTFDGSTLALTGNQTATLTVQAQGYECPATVSANWSIGANNNAMFPGPMTVANGVTVTVPANRTLTIV